MKNKRYKYFFGIFFTLQFLFVSCSPKITTYKNVKYQSLDNNQKVVVLNVNQKAPQDAVILGKVKVGYDFVFQKCNYDSIIDKLKTQARKIGGNIIKINKHRPFNSIIHKKSCHKIKASILKIDSIEKLLIEEKKIEDKLSNPDYATLHIYRYGGAVLLNYDLHLGDSILCNVKSNFKKTLYISKEGQYNLWAKAETKEEIPINIKFGEEYYIKCGVKFGILIGRPTLELMDKEKGKAEFESFNTKNH